MQTRTATTRQSEANESDGAIGYVTQFNVAIASDTGRRSAPLSVAAIKAGPAVLVPLDADTLLGARTHDVTDPDVVDRMHDWRGQAQPVSLREHSRAATSTWKVGRPWNRGSFAICFPAE